MSYNFIIDINDAFEFKSFPFDVTCFLVVSDACFVGFAFNGFELIFTFKPDFFSLTKCHTLDCFECSGSYFLGSCGIKMIAYPGVSDFGCVEMKVVFAKAKGSIECLKGFCSLFVRLTIKGFGHFAYSLEFFALAQ